MKYAIVYSSRTGNTKVLAEIIKDMSMNGELIYFGEPDSKALEAELLFIGFWTDKGTCEESMQKFLLELKGKKIFLFGTAGFGKNREYFEHILENVKKNIGEDNKMAGTYMCQGRMPERVRDKYEEMLHKDPTNGQYLDMILNFDEALHHPDEEDLKELKRLCAALYIQSEL